MPYSIDFLRFTQSKNHSTVISNQFLLISNALIWRCFNPPFKRYLEIKLSTELTDTTKQQIKCP